MVDGISGWSDYFLLGVLSVILLFVIRDLFTKTISHSALLWSSLVIPKITEGRQEEHKPSQLQLLGKFRRLFRQDIAYLLWRKGQCLIFKYLTAAHIIFKTIIPEIPGLHLT